MNKQAIADNQLSTAPLIKKLRSRGVTGALVMLLLICSRNASAGGLTVTVPFGDDLNTSTLTPLSTVSSLANAQAASISTAAPRTTDNANNVNPPPSGEKWTYNWAGAVAEANVEKGINVVTHLTICRRVRCRKSASSQHDISGGCRG